jgi:hypothetical protein
VPVARQRGRAAKNIWANNRLTGMRLLWLERDSAG